MAKCPKCDNIIPWYKSMTHNQKLSNLLYKIGVGIGIGAIILSFIYLALVALNLVSYNKNIRSISLSAGYFIIGVTLLMSYIFAAEIEKKVFYWKLPCGCLLFLFSILRIMPLAHSITLSLMLIATAIFAIHAKIKKIW